MSASTSCSERARALLDRLRGWDDEPRLDEVRALGEDCPDEFFRYVVEPLSDSFSLRDAKVYDRIMQAFIPVQVRHEPELGHPTPPETTPRVNVLSRVTLGADIKITSVIMDAAKKRYPEAEICFAGARKAAQLFAADPRVTWIEANYPRSGSIASRLEFIRNLRLENGIVIDPDSRFTQLGLELPCDPDHYFHFPSRIFNAQSDTGLGRLTAAWMEETFGVSGTSYLAPELVPVNSQAPRAAVSLGTGENPSKSVGGGFEAGLLRWLAARFRTLHVDRGAGGEERQRVDAAIRDAGLDAGAGSTGAQVQFCEGSFAEFASVISQCDAYFGYDSAGQHAAAAAGVPVTTIFAGAPNERFRMRWQPEGKAPIRVIPADGVTPEQLLEALH